MIEPTIKSIREENGKMVVVTPQDTFKLISYVTPDGSILYEEPVWKVSGNDAVEVIAKALWMQEQERIAEEKLGMNTYKNIKG